MFLEASQTNENMALIMLGICIIPIAVLIVLAFVMKFKKVSKSKLTKEDNTNAEVDPEVRKEFYGAYGGESNVTSVTSELSRIKVKVNNVELVNTEKLKELGAVNVLIIGDEVRASFSDRVSYVYNIMK